MQSAEGRALETDRQGTHARLGEKGECRCSNAEMEFWSCIRTLISGIRDELVARVQCTRNIRPYKYIMYMFFLLGQMDEDEEFDRLLYILYSTRI